MDYKHQAERLKLARVLKREVEELDYLAHLEIEHLRHLRESISAALFDEHAHLFQKLADASKLLPVSLTAKLSEKVFGPLISARVSGLMSVERAIAVGRKLETRFLADLTIEMDPRSARELLQNMPIDITLAVAAELERREDYLTMARFVDALRLEHVLEVAVALESESLLHVGLYVESARRLTEIIEHLPDDRLKDTAELTLGGGDTLQYAGLNLLREIDAGARDRIISAASIAAAGALKHLTEVLNET